MFEVAIVELNSVGDEEGFGGRVVNLKTAVVVESRSMLKPERL